jgi:hypothetical protein
MATYLNDLRLTELATGEGSGTWGTTTNLSLELIGEALGFATQQVFGSDADATTTIADGASDPARAMYFKITSAGSLTATRTCTIAPNTISRVMFIENATTGSQSIQISQGSGASVTILAGKTAVVYLDGAGSGAAVVDAMAGVDPGVTDTLAEVLAAGNTSGANNLIIDNGQAITTNTINETTAASGVTIDSVLLKDDGVNATNLEITNLKANDGTSAGSIADSTGVVTLASSVLTTADINGGTIDGTTLGATTPASVAATTGTFSGVVTANAGVVVDNITIDGSDIISSGSLFLDSDDANIYMSDGGTDIGLFSLAGQDLTIRNLVSDKDINFQGNDGGSTFTAFSLDMSAAGAATFNSSVVVNESGADADFRVESDTNANMLFVDGGANHIGMGTATLNRSGLGADHIVLTVGADTEMGMLELQGTRTSDADLGRISFLNAGTRRAEIVAARIDEDTSTKLYFQTSNAGSFGTRLTIGKDGAATFSSSVTADRIGSKYVYPTDATSQTSTVTNHFWKMGRMTLAGPAAAEIELHGLSGYGQGDPIAGKNIIQLRGSNSATVLGGTFHATGDLGIGIQEMRYVPIGDYVFDLYVKLGTFTSLSTTVTCGGTWAPEWTDTGSGSNPASSVDMPPHYALLLGNNIAMYADLSEVVFNDDSNDIDFRVESDGNENALFVDGGQDSVSIRTNSRFNSGALSVNGSITFNNQTAGTYNDASGFIDFIGADDANLLRLHAGADAGEYSKIEISTNIAGSQSDAISVENLGPIVINQDSVADRDFRVESDTNTHAIYVDAGNNSVTLGSSSSASNTFRVSFGGFQAATDASFSTTKSYTFRDGVGIDNPNASSFSTATAAVLCVGAMTSGRSINATGTINASGADYAEYEANNGLVISKGSIVGFKADGTLTLTFSEAVRFAVKSTDPAYVGGDTWADVEPPEKNTTAWDTWFAEAEAKRAKVDRVAYSGKVPVNVQGATAGQYIIAVANSSGEITGQAVTDPDFSQYKLSVGRVNKVLEDGRAEVAVIIH